MRIIPNEARLELYTLQQLCLTTPDIDYVDHIWAKRYEGEHPKSQGAWPYRSVHDVAVSNVTKLPKRGQK